MKTLVKVDSILFSTSRVLDGQHILDPENVMIDLRPMSFVKPVLDRFSPVSYSIMLYCHASLSYHRNVNSTLLESKYIAHIIGGRALSIEVRENCPFCRRYRAKLLQAEHGSVHPSRLTVAPAFWNSQVDLFGPMFASCEHNHRSKVKIWGVIFKCPATAAISVHCMQMYNAGAFVQAFTRFGSRYGIPKTLYIDEGSQLKAACSKMELNLTDIQTGLKSFETGISFSTCPVGGHNFHGVVERSVMEVKKLFQVCFQGLKLDVLSFETAFAKISNEINNIPICLGSKTDNLEHLDLICPNRLLLGRSNKRALESSVTMDTPSRLLSQLQLVSDSWWHVWETEKMLDIIPKPSQWNRTSSPPSEGDVVIFPRDERDENFGQAPWRVGRVVNVESSKDGVPRSLVIQYKNSTETKFRTTRRALRRVAILFSEDELSLVDQLNLASKCVDKEFVMYMNQF